MSANEKTREDRCIAGNDDGPVCSPNYTDRSLPYGYSDPFCPVHGHGAMRILGDATKPNDRNP